jgi:hypothetical protein
MAYGSSVAHRGGMEVAKIGNTFDSTEYLNEDMQNVARRCIE